MQIKLGKPSASTLIYPLACALVVIGAKCWMIGRYGNPTPFWDQWDAEGALLYPRYLGGTLQLADLIAPHNEHRILMTRLWSLLLLELEGYWDPILQMLANALILGAVIALLVAAFRPLLTTRSWTSIAAFTTMMFALPFAWENTLQGFNSQWYFLLLISLVGLLVVTRAAAFTARWWLATLLLSLSYFCMAGGALTALSASIVCIVQFICRRRAGRLEILAILILTLMTAAMIYYVPVRDQDAPLKAHTIIEFVRALAQILSWPATPGPVPILIKSIFAIFINLPAVLAIGHVISERPPLHDRRWFLIALGGWTALQIAAIAYGRAAGPLAPRYLDTFALGTILNAACLLYLIGLKHPLLNGRRGIAALVVWFGLILPGLSVAAVLYFNQAAASMVTAQLETQNLRAYLDTGDIGTLENKPLFDIPYPDAKRLAAIASSPVIRALLPPELVGAASAARAQQRGVARYTGHAVEAFKNLARRWGVMLIPIGLLIFALSFGTQFRRAKMDGETSPHA